MADMASFAGREGLFDRRRREWETSTWLSEGDGVGDLEFGATVAVRGGDEWLATGEERERCMDIILGPCGEASRPGAIALRYQRIADSSWEGSLSAREGGDWAGNEQK